MRDKGLFLWAFGFTLFAVLPLAANKEARSTPWQCPGVVNNVCTRACQAAVCEALGRFYKVSNNASSPWDNEAGWQASLRTPCSRLITQQLSKNSAPTGQPGYCSWFGVVCCSQRAALQGNCTVINSIKGLSLPLNNLNVSLDDPEFVSAVGQLHACGLTDLDLEANNLSGGMEAKGWSDMVNLRVVNVANAYCGGRIPTALRRMRNLTSVTLSNNYFYGTLPAWLGELKQLEVINMAAFAGYDETTGLTGTIPEQLGDLRKLKQLILHTNFLSGTLPPQLCSGRDPSQLVLLSLRSNLLEGPAQALEGCGNLVQLDIRENAFTGALPASTDWRLLTTYQVANNNFTGPLPIRLLQTAKMLDRLDVSFNQLSGYVPGQITLLTSMQVLRLANNRFTGTLTENVYLLPVLQELDVSNNYFVGTIPPFIEYSYALQVLDYTNNTGMTGTIPPQMAFLSGLQRARFTGTNMSCSGITKPFVITTNASCTDPDLCRTEVVVTGEAGNGTALQCTEEQLLPCFLQFSDIAVPREDASNMRCKYIVRKTPEHAKLDCAQEEYGSYFLGESVQYLPGVVKDSTQQSWLVEPAYYQYRECSCLQGYAPVWDVNNTVLRCNPEPAVDRRTIIIVSAVSAVAGLALLAALLLLGQLYLRTRPRWLRERVMQAKRLQGAPKCAKPGDKVTVSIVVTDVKDYSANMRQFKDMMVKAMGAHNNILRKACHAHAGYVMDQEGDSWTIAFHDPQDAVAFSLQVQQALAQKVWGMQLPSNRTFDHHTLDALRIEGSARSSSFSHPRTASQMEQIGELRTSDMAIRDNRVGDHHTGALTSATAANHHGGSIHIPRSSSFTSSTALSSLGHSSQTGSDAHGRNQSFSIANIFNRQRMQRNHDHRSKQRSDGAKQTPPMVGSTGALGVPTRQPEQQRRSAEEDFDGTTADAAHLMPKCNGIDAATAAASVGKEDSHQYQPSSAASDIECGGSSAARSHTPASFSSSISAFLSNASEGAPDLQRGGLHSSSLGSSPGSVVFSQRKRGVTSALMHKLSQITGRSGPSSSTVAAEQQSLKLLRIAVRIGIASGPLPYGATLGNCAVKHRAKRLVSEVAAGGQVLCDETTFTSIKDSLSVLGTVNEGGYDNDLLQRLMHAQVIGKLQRQVVCSPCPSFTTKPEVSFTGGLFSDREPQDYDNDAIVVHMGCFNVPDAYKDEHTGTQSSESDSDTAPAKPGQLEVVVVNRTPSKSKMRSSQKRAARQKLHLYSIAAPGMRKWPENTQTLSRRLSWADPVYLKPGWVQMQKGYFEAPSASQADLMVSSEMQDPTRPNLLDVTVVFVTLDNGASFEARHSSKECHAVHKATIKVMQQQLRVLQNKDGYISRSQESDFGYMLAFEHPHTAVQWCLLVQEALMYVSWPDYVLSHPGFEEVICPATGLLLFRGPRLRMGLAEGAPTSVLPDHNGRANYFGGSVNRAARFMDAAAHGGQIVTNVDLVRKLMMDWVAEDREGVMHTSASATVADADMANGEVAAVTQSGLTRAASSSVSINGRSSGLSADDTKARDQSEGVLRSDRKPPMMPAAPLLRKQHPLLPTPHLMQQLATRSNSETAAAGSSMAASSRFLRSYKDADTGMLGPSGRSKSFTSGLTSYTIREEPFSMQQQTSFSRSSGSHDSPNPVLRATQPPLFSVAAEADAVLVQHIGRFTFKGSGEYDMVQLLHTAIARRTFPAEPPRGKGWRVGGSGSGHGVEDLPVVYLRVPAQVAAARAAFRVTRS